MKPFKFLIILVGLICAGEPAAPAPLSLKDSIERGLGFSLEIQKAESEKRAAQDDYRLARSKLLPKIDLNAAAGPHETSDNYGGGFSHAYKARLDLEQPLFTSGVISSGLTSARLNRDVAEQKAFTIRQDYIFKIVEAYYKAAQAQVVLTLAKDNRSVLKNYLDITTRYAAIGRSKNVDRLQAEASYNLSEAQVLDAESSLEQLRQDLVRLLGEEAPLDVPLDPKLNLQPYDPGSAGKLLRQALDSNPAIKSLHLQVESIKYANKAKMIDHRPSLSLKGSWGYDAKEYDTWFKSRGEAYDVFLNLKIPLFSGFSSFAQSDQLFEQRLQLEKDLAIRQKELQRTLVTSLSTMQRDFQRLKLTQLSAVSSKKAMDVAVRDYRNGLLSSTDVLNIQRTRFDADRQNASAQYSYNQQMLNLRRDLGVDLEKAYEN